MKMSKKKQLKSKEKCLKSWKSMKTTIKNKLQENLAPLNAPTWTSGQQRMCMKMAQDDKD